MGILRPVPKFGVLGAYCAQRRAQNIRVTFRVQGWSASKVRWSAGSVYLRICLQLFGLFSFPSTNALSFSALRKILVLTDSCESFHLLQPGVFDEVGI